MFNIGPPELIIILLVALLIVGPKRLPEVGKSVGRALREIRRQTDEVRSSFEATIDVDDDDEPDVHAVEDRTGSETAVTEWGGEDDEAPQTTLAEAEDPAAPDPVETGTSRRRRKAAQRAADSATADPAPAAVPAPDDES